MRLYVLYALIVGTMAWGLRDWFVALCGVVALSALMQHDDMPRTMWGIQGLNPSNVLLAWTMIVWAMQRVRLRPVPRLPVFGKLLVAAYLAAIVFAWARGVIDLDSIQGPYRDTVGSFGGFTVEFLINPLKYIIPAFLLYDGVRTQRHVYLAFVALAIMALLYSVIVIKNLPLSTLVNEEGYMASRHRIQEQSGLHANDMALVMTQGFWAMILYARTCVKPWVKVGTIVAAAALGLAAALCHSRAGYFAFVATGLVVGAVCWRRMLLLLVPALVVVCIAFPTIPARVLAGVGQDDVSGGQTNDWDVISAGRTSTLWPAAVTQIEEAPLIGVGRLAIMRTDMYESIGEAEGLVPTHPHNAYLELLCDGGAVTLAAVVVGIVVLLCMAAGMSRGRRNVTSSLVGAICLASLVALAVSAVSGQSFWPRENVFGTACVIGVMVRLWTLRQRSINGH